MNEPFTHEPHCVKCDTMDTELEFHQVVGGDSKQLLVTCKKCANVWFMDSADAKGGASAEIPKKD